MKKKIAIIGGGITGLSTAYFIEEKSKELGIDVDCTLIEADHRWGGKIVSDRVADFIIEGGPDSFLSQKPWGVALCRKLGLIDQIVQSHPVHKAIYLLSEGKLKKFPEGMNLMVPGRIIPFLLSPLVSLCGKARMGLDLLIPGNLKEEDESIAAFVRRRLGNEAVKIFAEPILATVYAGDVEKLSLKATFPQFAALEDEFRSLIFGIWMKKSAHLKEHPKNHSGMTGKQAIPMTMFITLKDGMASIITALQGQLRGTACRIGQRVNQLSPQKGGYVILSLIHI